MSQDFEALVGQYQQLVLHLIRRSHGGALAHLGEDLAQDVWTKLWDSFSRHESSILHFKSYLYRTVQTTLWDAMQRLQTRPTSSLEDELAEPAGPCFAEPVEQALDLDRRLELLGRQERLMVRAWLQGYNYEEIAGLLGISEGRVRNSLSRAKKRMEGKQ
jgi:RNA polymerase sigma factor (sigma-70 family)